MKPITPTATKTDTKRRTLLRWMALAAAGSPMLLHAQAYPTRPVRIILPYASGGSADVVTRLLAQQLGQSLGQQFIVENRPGASGNIGLEQMVRSAPDGYTLAVVPDSNMTVNPHLFPDLKFDPVKDTSPIAMLTTIGIGLVVHPSVPARNVQELLDHAQRRPEGVSYATPGNGTPHHLAGELLRQRSGANLRHVPYKGGAPAVQDVVGGHVEAGFVALSVAAAHARADRLRILAVTQKQRFSMFPDVPSVGETVPDFDVTSWLALFAPAATPADVISRLNGEVARALGDAAVKQKLATQALDVIGGSAADLSARVRQESDRWRALIKARNITI